MYKLKVNNAGNGMQFVLSEDEFNAWILQFDDVLERIYQIGSAAVKKDIKLLKNARGKLMSKSEFDTKAREVYCFLPTPEFEIAVHFLTFDLPSSGEADKYSPFLTATKNPLSKKRIQ